MATDLNAPSTSPGAPSIDRSGLLNRYQAVRKTSEHLASPLGPEDYLLQSMPDASPVKWHLAHTTWFFETFVLAPHAPGYRVFDNRFGFLFNSYYNAVGDRILRSRRGLLSRPTVSEVNAYRAHVDSWMARFLGDINNELPIETTSLILLGTHHEQQHQELIATDLKHAFGLNPLQPAYLSNPSSPPQPQQKPSKAWIEFPEGLREIGHTGDGFFFDNEAPRHRQFVGAFALASQAVTNREYLRFIEDRGYSRPEFWLSEGWDTCRNQQWVAPLYWEQRNNAWWTFTLAGPRPVNLDEPVVHLSYFEADAFARWAGARLPTEAEWETAASTQPIQGNFLESGHLHPVPSTTSTPGPLFHLFGNVWEWTASPYTAYPGFRPAEGAVGEYNGKFMCNQFVLRGGSCATPTDHIRASYRNFFHPHCRWQFSGVRLAQDLR